MFLEKIKSPSDLKKINKSDYPALCDEIRRSLVENVMKTGGHLASNLGVVELTLAYHLVFDCPKDKIVFDVGHQSYVHKMLTGRYEKFPTIRQMGGLSGFPKPSESDCDAFVAGHASTSVSAALGIARARDILGEDYNVCAFIGDGALGGGMVYEAFGDAGTSKTRLIVILNDNEMSIEKNVGGMSEYLSRLRTAKKYLHTKNSINSFLTKMGKAGDIAKHTISTVKDAFKYSAIAGGIFENLGFTYIGIIDGHNINSLIDVFRRAKELDGPVLIHTFTKKGMGYENAENDPEAFHGISRKATLVTKNAINFSSAAGEILKKLAANNKKIVALTAAMATGCGLCDFAKKFPERFFDVGIAEQHMVTNAAGMASGGLIPVVAVYSTFLQRAYDQLIHDVCLSNFHVVFLVDRAGIVGEDGETHQGIFDLSYLSHMPNMKILAPSCFKELEQMMNFAVNECEGP
ncbi:MAG: 1-deoxy-D-xylulose-5-phosphate synthase, partial [Oscillospiraceae bacterium]|nr:1-deoxy-D-xylulose-5-phosphate synthase [Oscillospiraceae bacterium]